MIKNGFIKTDLGKWYSLQRIIDIDVLPMKKERGCAIEWMIQATASIGGKLVEIGISHCYETKDVAQRRLDVILSSS